MTLVSCVMPTFDRRPFIRAAIECWLQQSYEPRELIVLDDGRDRVRDLVPADSRIRYYEIGSRISTGAKRNRCCELARGGIICHFDDDDWSAPWRIGCQLRTLAESGKPATGLASILYWDLVTLEAKRYTAAVRGYVCGGTLCYRKAWWEQHPFPDQVKSSDNRVIYPNRQDIVPAGEASMYVARAHASNIGGDKRGIGPVISREELPAAFWENERFRLEGVSGL